MAIRFDNIEAINLLNNQGEQTIALTNDQGIIVSGNVAMATGNATGKFAVMATGVHASYDFYNNGTSYFNGGVVVDAGLSQTGGADVTFTGDVGIGTDTPDAKLHILKAAGGANIVTGLKLDPDDATTNSGISIDFNASTTNTGASLVGSRIVGAREGGNASGFLALYTSPDASGSVPLERMRITSGGDVGIGTTSPSSESNLSLGAKSASEGGHLTLFKGTSNTHATHIDNYEDSFRIMKGTDASSSTAQFSLSHATGNATFAGAVSTGGYLTLNSSDEIPRLIFNGSGDNFMFSNTANYFGLYNDTDSRWDIQVDGAGTATFGGAINATSGSFTGETHIGSVSDGPFTALRLMNQKTYGSGTGTNEKVRFAMGIAESGIAYSGREGFVIDVGVNSESDSSNAVINFQARDGGVIGTYQTVNGHDKSVEFVGNATFGGTINSGTITSTGIVKAATTFQSTAGSMSFYVPNVGQALEIAQNTGNATFAGGITTGGDINVPEYVVHDGDTNTHIRFTSDRIRLVAGGTVKFDSNSPYITGLDWTEIAGDAANINVSGFNNDAGYLTALPSHNHDDRYYTETEINTKYTTTDGSGDEWKFTLGDESSLTGNKWYKVAWVNTGSGGLHIKGSISNHVESFGTQKVDLLLQGREGDDGDEIEITGTVDVLHNATGTSTDKAGIRVIKSAVGTYYDTYMIYIRTTRYSQAKFHLTKFGTTGFDTSKPSVTSEPAPVSGGNVELDTSTLTEGHYVIVDSAAKLSVGSDITLNGFGAGYLKTNVNGVISNTATIPWATVSSTPTTISGYGITDALAIGTTSTTAMAGNTSLFDGAYSSLSGTPTLGTAAAAATGDFAAASHTHAATDITSGTLNASRLPKPVSGDWWNGGAAVVGTDGVMEIGKYIDFHGTDTATTDFDYRMYANSGTMTFSGDGLFQGGDLYIVKQNDAPTLTLLHDGTNPSTNDLLFKMQFQSDYNGVHQDWGKIVLETNSAATRTDMDFYVKSTGGAEQIGFRIQGGASTPKAYFYNDVDVDGDLTADNFSGSSSGTNTGDQDLSSFITSQRAISSTPTDGATTTAISSDWAFDNVKTAVPANALFTDDNTTYSAGTGLDLTGTTFSIEPDLRDGITKIGKDSSNYIAIDADDNNSIDFYVSGVWVARMEADGDLHMKGDVIAFSDIFNP